MLPAILYRLGQYYTAWGNTPPPGQYSTAWAILDRAGLPPSRCSRRFPSTELYKGCGALVQLDSASSAGLAIQYTNNLLLPGCSQPLLVRYADSPAEKAAKAARKERLQVRGGGGGLAPYGALAGLLPGSGAGLALHDHLRQQLLLGDAVREVFAQSKRCRAAPARPPARCIHRTRPAGRKERAV